MKRYEAVKDYLTHKDMGRTCDTFNCSEKYLKRQLELYCKDDPFCLIDSINFITMRNKKIDIECNVINIELTQENYVRAHIECLRQARQKRLKNCMILERSFKREHIPTDVFINFLLSDIDWNVLVFGDKFDETEAIHKSSFEVLKKTKKMSGYLVKSEHFDTLINKYKKQLEPVKKYKYNIHESWDYDKYYILNNEYIENTSMNDMYKQLSEKCKRLKERIRNYEEDIKMKNLALEEKTNRIDVMNKKVEELKDENELSQNGVYELKKEYKQLFLTQNHKIKELTDIVNHLKQREFIKPEPIVIEKVIEKIVERKPEKKEEEKEVPIKQQKLRLISNKYKGLIDEKDSIIKRLSYKLDVLIDKNLELEKKYQTKEAERILMSNKLDSVNEMRDNLEQQYEKLVERPKKKDVVKKVQVKPEYILAIHASLNDISKCKKQKKLQFRRIKEYPIMVLYFIPDTSHDYDYEFDDNNNIVYINCRNECEFRLRKTYHMIEYIYENFKDIRGVFITDITKNIDLNELHIMLDKYKNIKYYGSLVNIEENQFIEYPYEVLAYKILEHYPILLEKCTYCTGDGYFINSSIFDMFIENKRILTKVYDDLQPYIKMEDETKYISISSVFCEYSIGKFLYDYGIIGQDVDIQKAIN